MSVAGKVDVCVEAETGDVIVNVKADDGALVTPHGTGSGSETGVIVACHSWFESSTTSSPPPQAV